MAPATWRTDSKSTSPHNRIPSGLLGSATKLMPTSMTVAPGLIQSAPTTSGRPMAEITTSAWQQQGTASQHAVSRSHAGGLLHTRERTVRERAIAVSDGVHELSTVTVAWR